MSLVNLATVSSLLACPGCRSSLLQSEGGYRCSSDACDLGRGESFPLVGEWPILVDFRESILRADRFQAAPDLLPRLGQGRWSSELLPARLRVVWKPVNRVAAHNIDLLLSHLPGASPLILVIGGGTVGNGTDALYATHDARVLAFDVYASPNTQFIADTHQIPLTSESVDAVVIQAVLEHVLDPARVVGEIARVLKPGGLVYSETPFLQQVHAGPYDFSRYTSSGHRYLFRAFEEISAGPVAGPGTELAWSVDHLTRGLLRSELAGKIAKGLFFWLRYLDRLVPRAFAMDSASAYYFFGRLGERELTPHEIVAYYPGAQRSST